MQVVLKSTLPIRWVASQVLIYPLQCMGLKVMPNSQYNSEKEIENSKLEKVTENYEENA